MKTMTYEEVRRFKDSYTYVPIAKEIYADVVTPISLLRKIAQLDSRYYLLESVEGGEKWARFSFLGFGPILKVTAKNHQVTVESGEIRKQLSGEPMEELKKLMEEYKAPRIEGLPSFTGGFVGYFAYEVFGYTEPKLKIKENDFEDYELLLYDKVIAYDHLKQKICLMVNVKLAEGELGYRKALHEIDKMIHLINQEAVFTEEQKVDAPHFTCNTSKEMYMKMVEKTKAYIREGDIFQGVISRRFEAEYEGSLLNAYRVLRTTNPSPYMYFIQCDNIQIAGASPETMVKLVDGQLTTFPVAGTRKRGVTEKEDRQLEAELLADEKELSEHNMLVDLARNDIGRIAEYGSVHVQEYKQIHRFSKVMHIASVVTGQLKKEKVGVDAIQALLPAGTLSGAPKIRACEIIDELEPVSRGIYGGAIGYLDLSGNLDVCIGIRTAVKRENKVYVQAGAGIVADSVPESEYMECANKAGAVIEAIERANEVMGK